MEIERKPAKRMLPQIKDLKSGSVFVRMEDAKDKAAYMALQYGRLEDAYMGKRKCVNIDDGALVTLGDQEFVVACRAVMKLEVPIG